MWGKEIQKKKNNNSYTKHVLQAFFSASQNVDVNTSIEMAKAETTSISPYWQYNTQTHGKLSLAEIVSIKYKTKMVSSKPFERKKNFFCINVTILINNQMTKSNLYSEGNRNCFCICVFGVCVCSYVFVSGNIFCIVTFSKNEICVYFFLNRICCE